MLFIVGRILTKSSNLGAQVGLQRVWPHSQCLSLKATFSRHAKVSSWCLMSETAQNGLLPAVLLSVLE